MNSTNINIFTVFKSSILTVLAALLVSSLIQLNFPTLQEIGESITTVWVERQMNLEAPQHRNLLKQGWTYYSLGRLEKAKALMEKVYKEDGSISALYCLGLIDLRYRRFDDSIAKLETVISASPEHVPTMMALGESYFQQRYYGRSKNLFEKAVECEPTNTKARIWLGRTYINLNETDKAREVLGTVNSGPEAGEAAALLKNI